MKILGKLVGAYQAGRDEALIVRQAAFQQWLLDRPEGSEPFATDELAYAAWIKAKDAARADAARNEWRARLEDDAAQRAAERARREADAARRRSPEYRKERRKKLLGASGALMVAGMCWAEFAMLAVRSERDRAAQAVKVTRDDPATGQKYEGTAGNAEEAQKQYGLITPEAYAESQLPGAVRQRSAKDEQPKREDVLQQPETERTLATLRAQERRTDFNNRKEILAKAATLGLNVEPLRIDTSKVDRGTAREYLNNQFQQLGIDRRIGAQEMANILAFTQAMGTIQFDYDKMSDADQQRTLVLMISQYGIDQGTARALHRLKDSRKIDWTQLLTSMAAWRASRRAL